MGRPKGSKNKPKKLESLPSSNAEQGSCKAEVTGSSPVGGSEVSRLDRLEILFEKLLVKLDNLPIKKEVDSFGSDPRNDPAYKNDRIVNINVRPEVQINGHKFVGFMKLPEGLAERIKCIMQTREDAKQKELQFIDHGNHHVAHFKGEEGTTVFVKKELNYA